MNETLDTIEAELKRTALARKRRQKSKTIVFQKIHKGLYISHEWGMTLDHEATWLADVCRKWVLTWKESYRGLMAPSQRRKKFHEHEEKQVASMIETSLSPWSTEGIAQSFRSEIRARFEAHSAAFRERDAAALEIILRARPEKRGQPGFEARDSFFWCVYKASEIRIICNEVTVVLPRGYAVGLDFVYLFDRTSVAWSTPSIGAILVEGEACPTI